jgi:8-oxo-dGTP diphosphatase
LNVITSQVWGNWLMRGDGDAWVRCASGHRHWGRFGAAGLFLTDGRRVILQHRAPWTHEGDTWGLPGGARDSGETPVRAALREAHEEAGLDAADVAAIGLSIADHDGWTYTSVVARTLRTVHPHAANEESVQIRWWDFDEVEHLPLHPGLSASWPTLSQPVPRLVLVVTPDRMVAASALSETGIPTRELPPGLLETELDVLFPRLSSNPDDVDESETALRIGSDVGAAWLEVLLRRSNPASAARST